MASLSSPSRFPTRPDRQQPSQGDSTERDAHDSPDRCDILGPPGSPLRPIRQFHLRSPAATPATEHQGCLAPYPKGLSRASSRASSFARTQALVSGTVSIVFLGKSPICARYGCHKAAVMDLPISRARRQLALRQAAPHVHARLICSLIASPPRPLVCGCLRALGCPRSVPLRSSSGRSRNPSTWTIATSDFSFTIVARPEPVPWRSTSGESTYGNCAKAKSCAEHSAIRSASRPSMD